MFLTPHLRAGLIGWCAFGTQVDIRVVRIRVYVDMDACDASLHTVWMSWCGCHDVTALHYEEVDVCSPIRHGIEDAKSK
ncbi:MAG: hypothetical protein J6X16_01365 [Bacteroidales bacterium]|nr:hypothetical protein [Bacteroidales bacterium]